ncbi:TIGR04168 family protein [filamentous cyanobacterium LEGE 11480]|uniref:TIGR04168 family protein n=1 Tax=Romeriopsis navalis LEGE 11480 TaxID=2777977 RepID=A0A928VV52_9CYAN|nr:TIGR04168 family protein [Romeriopsis navalis]MBE9033082.1 TIGR04168 family protein [Romeriopsis navalis LEGE 11480]
MTASPPSLRIAIVGDVHNQWDEADHRTLEALGVDLVLFVGDFGNEAVNIVRQISQLALPKAVVMGNHDAWYSATSWGKQRCPYDRTQEDWVQQQLDLLGDSHVGYGCKDFPDLGVSVIGARPFSWGGAHWKYSKFYKERFGIHSFQESTKRIVQSMAAATSEHLLVIAHNGPTGLGDQPRDPVGKDWGDDPGGDYGDPDLTAAIAQAPSLGKQIPLVTFGHMHHSLRQPKGAARRTYHRTDQTFYCNAACVPRVRELQGETLRHFALVEIAAGQLQRAAQAWVNIAGQVVAESIDYSAPDATRRN